ncbi:MAG: hypothetical protein IJ079_06390 [Lachnospiraceae bacterium]|nr:hypothetical protein [Lachnospiraceae bacterium]
MKARKITAIILAVILCAGLTLTGCGKEGSSVKKNSKNHQAAADGKDPSAVWVLRVDDNDVYLNEVNFYALSLLEGMGVEQGTDMSAYYSESYPTLDSAFKAQLLLQMRQTKILYQKAVERGLTLTAEEEAEMNELVDAFIQNYDSDTQEEYGFDRDVLVKIYTEMGLIKKLENTLQEEAEYEKQDYGTFYNFVFLTIELDENGNGVLDENGQYVELSQDEILAQKTKAEEVLNRLKNGADPESVIEEYDLSATSGLMHATSDSLRDTYGLKDGEVSELIQNDFGYSIEKMVSVVDSDYSETVNAYNESSSKSNAVEDQENAWFDSYFFTADDVDSEVWGKFTFQDFL